MNDLLRLGIIMLAVNLLWYPIARKRPPENRFLSENLTFWRWFVYSIIVVAGTLIVSTLLRVLTAAW